jgi:hypothetical protein
LGSSIVGTGRAELHVPAGCHAECRFERPGEVGLVREAGLERCFCQGPRVAQPAPGHVEAPHHRIPVRAGPVDGAKLACKLVAVQARDRLHLARLHYRQPAPQEIAATLDGGQVDPAAQGAGETRGAAPEQALRQLKHQSVKRQRLRRTRERRTHHAREDRGVGHRGSERQRPWPSREGRQGGGDPVRADIDLAVAEQARPICPAIVQFVGMQHEDLSREAALNRAPVGERLDTLLGDADRVDIVPVAAERAATQASTEQFHPIDRPGGVYPFTRAARTFKTSADCVTQAGGHGSNLRSGAWKSCMTLPS